MIPSSQTGNESVKRPKRVMIVVGEASGDLHGAHLVKALYRRDPTLEIFGVAGDGLKREGIKVIFDVDRLTGMGFAELAGNLKTIWQAYRLLRKALREERPNLLILVDFPEFNLRLARLAKKSGIPVLYYISPQVWAWRKRRTQKIARWVDRMAVVFPFEVPLYQNEGVAVSFVGHPLLDLAHSSEPRERTLTQYGLDPSRQTIAILPGSRSREVAYHLPPMLEAADRLERQLEAQFILVRATTVERGILDGILEKAAVKVPIAEGNTYNVLHACDLVWAASGTATLETALMLRPMVIVYRLSWLTYALARLLVRVSHIGMVNIIAGESVVPELIQSDVTADKIVAESRAILQDPELRKRIVSKLSQVREKLGSPGASERVAEIAFSMIS
ncbi:MAG TPA: lipid-A-disaccharide synthase [Deltaproteobacteria bacterium]|nr:lipid-A-disaccharide synthase [Deltaproteobacteria bacterium]